MIHLRVLAPDEWQLWRELRLAALEESPTVFGSSLKDWQGDGDREERWRQRLMSVPFNCVAYVEGKPAGMVSGGWNGHDVELLSLWVAPHARGRGVGEKLVESVMAWARDQQASHIVLSVRDHNAPAISLYCRHGFHATGPSPESDPGMPETLFKRPM